MNWYSYIITTLYNWGKKNDSTPVANVVITMLFVHFVQIFTVYMLLLKYTDIPVIFEMKNARYIVLPILAAISFIYYRLVYNKQSWEKNSTVLLEKNREKRLYGKIYVLTYLIGSIVLLFLVFVTYNI